MIVLVLAPQPKAVTILAADGDRSSIIIPFTDEWKMSGTDRPRWYGELRARLIERARSLAPQVLCIQQLEPMALKRGRPRISWFHTAEVRGVVAEAAHEVRTQVEFVTQGDVTRAMSPTPARESGKKRRPAADFMKDDSFWATVLRSELPKKYREAALLALSVMDV
jgi:hypothetical protein